MGRVDTSLRADLLPLMSAPCQIIAATAALLLVGCAWKQQAPAWQAAVDHQIAQLGYRNWIVVAEPSFPAQNLPGVRQVSAPVGIPEAVDYVLTSMERTENLRPRVYLTRELRSVENDFAPGIDEFRPRLTASLHGHETTELDQQALLVLLEDINTRFDVLVIRTQTALPYSSVFFELQPGYWDASSESWLRDRMSLEPLQKLVRPER